MTPEQLEVGKILFTLMLVFGVGGAIVLGIVLLTEVLDG